MFEINDFLMCVLSVFILILYSKIMYGGMLCERLCIHF